jgi:hypothetical protein
MDNEREREDQLFLSKHQVGKKLFLKVLQDCVVFVFLRHKIEQPCLRVNRKREQAASALNLA